jgi:hypothetical protein
MNQKKFIHPDSLGQDWGIVFTEQLWANVYAIKYNCPENKLDKRIWLKLFNKAKAAAIGLGAEVIETRIRLDYEPEIFRGLVQDLGFQKKAGRIEYQCTIQNLPGEQGSPLHWQTAKDLHWDNKQIADFTKEITTNALDFDPNEKPEDFIQDWLHHRELLSGPEFIAVGLQEAKPCALVVAQTHRNSGYSRISYMGLVPSHRGKHLGKWVHRHGFAMMKEQGGTLYRGGTHTENFPMRKLFESHGCYVSCEMEEWSYRQKGKCL